MNVCAAAAAMPQIEDQELSVAHHVFDVVPEHPEKHHIADQMEPPAVHEHGREHGPVLRRRLHQADHARSKLDPTAGPGSVEDLAGDEAKVANRARERLLGAGPLQNDESQDVGDQDGDGDDGGTLGGVLVLVRKHEAESRRLDG